MNIFNENFQFKQQELDQNGFIKIDFLPLPIVEELKLFYAKMPNSKHDAFGFHVSLDLKSEAQINEISNYISKKIMPFSESYFNAFQFISPRFAIKEANQNSLIPPHQDWSFVDESEYQSYNLWIALSPSTLENGTLGFLKGSHLKLKNIRATPLPIFKVPFNDFAMELLPYLEYIPLQPGQAILFNSRVIHASKPNQTKDARINVAVELTHNLAQLKHYYLNPINNRIDEFNIDESFFTKYSNAKITDIYKQKKEISEFEKVKVFDNRIEKSRLKDLI
ncbi:MAG: phytanoyl-CoA dioxygenase family protein [Bacteroidetes bacterium]|nr:phytanoyl-CoA dioxygenase family protein [Bacteroidota bacterium]